MKVHASQLGSGLVQDLRAAGLAAAPTLGGLAVLACGGMLLASGATPSEPTRFRQLLSTFESLLVPSFLIDFSHFLSSTIGLVLILLAFGLRSRLGAAWLASVTLLLTSAFLALLKGFNWEESLVLLFTGLLLSTAAEAFPRRARLTQMEITPGWMLNALAIIIGAAALGAWSFSHPGEGIPSWWRMMADEDAERAVRSSGGAALLLLIIGIWRMFATPATPPVVGEADPEFARVRQILGTGSCVEPISHLALLGDKRFLFSESGQSFLMFGVRGKSWVALGAPVGLPEEQLDLMWAFREMADAHAARFGFYGLNPEDLPAAVEMGLSIQKIGESATVPLDNFSLSGRKREALRRNWRKAKESAAHFEVLEPNATGLVMERLKVISDEWLEKHAGGEKSFSLGGFVPAYVTQFPIALVRWEGVIVAFATIWTTPDRSRVSMDLMRYCDAAPPNIMDFLFVELIRWAQENDYQAFDFGTAPLAGLEQRPLAPILSRVGNLVFERGEEIYNFRGVRRYKDKYDPIWQPRYVAGANKWSIPRILADVGLMSSGGIAGLTRRAEADSNQPTISKAV